MTQREYLLKEIMINSENGNREQGLRSAIDLIRRGLEVESDLELLKSYFPEKYSNGMYSFIRKSSYYHDTFYEAFQKHNNYKEFEATKYTGPLVINDEDAFNNYVNPRIQFYNNKVNIQVKHCNNYIINKAEVIKCASKTDHSDPSQISALIDRSWDNKYYDSLFSLLSIFIAENNKLTFLFSNKLETQLFSDHLETNYEFKTFIHESYHALQELLFNGNEFYYNYLSGAENHPTKDSFIKSLKETCINMLKVLVPEDKAIEQYDLDQIVDLIDQKINNPETEFCRYHLYPKLLGNVIFNENENDSELPEESKGLTPLEIAKKFFVEKCLDIENKYNISALIVERFKYITSIYKDYDSRSEGIYSLEVMPITFDLMASGIDAKSLDIFSPMIAYFDTNVFPIIENYKELHLEHHCKEFIDNQSLQCFQPFYGYSGQCIIDFID